ncbi:hypothetical protein C0992_000967, partial [Termitomyces sp. T32_za158]
GTYLGTLQGVNHLDLVGWINTARYKWAEMMGKEIKFRPATFYLGIADMLAGEVDGVPREGEDERHPKNEDDVREELSEVIAQGTTTPNDDDDQRATTPCQVEQPNDEDQRATTPPRS